MNNNIDFIYEYSDLNLFNTRVQILTGKYAGAIVEFGGSGVMAGLGHPVLNFEYRLYVEPKFMDDKFRDYLTNLLIAVVTARAKDPEESKKLDEAASKYGVRNPKIKLPECFYANKVEVI